MRERARERERRCGQLLTIRDGLAKFAVTLRSRAKRSPTDRLPIVAKS